METGILLRAVHALSRVNVQALADRFDFSKHQTLCDVAGTAALLCIEISKKHPHLDCVSFDRPAMEPLAKQHIATAHLTHRITTASGDIFRDPLPRADVITVEMGIQDRRPEFAAAVYKALSWGGALIMITESRELEDSTEAYVDFRIACEEAGFNKFEVIPLGAAANALVAYKN